MKWLLLLLILIPIPEKAVNMEKRPELIKVDNIARVSCYIDKGTMANGQYTYHGAVAFSDRSVPLNQDIYVEGFGEMFIADRTALWVHEKYDVPTIDVWMTEEDCKAFGLKYLSYKIL